MPGHKVFLQDDGEIREGLTCAYCKLVLKDPVQTSVSGQRLCRECYEKASKDPSQPLDPSDEIWPDFAVKREIANLKVKCENYIIGCDWKGLFKQLMQHSQECQYITVECRNPGCGQRVLLGKIEIHLKEECPRRHVSCKDCGKEMYFIELQDHIEVCPNAPRKCKNCDKVIPASKLSDHMIYECKHVKCVCKEESRTYEVGSTEFHDHLQDTGKLADHLGPIICEFTKMSGAFKEMTAAYQQAVKRIDTLEKGHQENAHRIEMLESARKEDAKIIEMLKRRNNELEEIIKQTDKKVEVVESKCDDTEKKYEMLEKKVEMLEKDNYRLSQENLQIRESERLSLAVVPQNSSPSGTVLQQIESKVVMLEQQLTNVREETVTIANKNSSQLMNEIEVLKQQYNMTLRSSSKGFNSEVVPYEKSSSALIKQVEDKVLEVERTLNVLSVHHSELELQLQASLASTHNGAFLWRIPEVRRRIRDAKMGRITSIYSPPFYTGRNGYKMCIRAYLNGDGSGEGTHLSIFFVLMRGEYDPLLQWPFEPKVSLILVDQDHKKHLVQTFKPNAQSSSFQRPKTDMNVASGCPEFADLSVLDNTSHVKDDVMYIKAIVDTSKIFHP